MAIEIRDFAEQADYEACARLQMEVWGFPEAETVPALHLIALHHFGGVCIGAFDGARMVGFVCGFTGLERGRVFHHSHMLAVLPDYRGQRLGEELKWAQRDRVLEQGLTLVNWTFDPLQALNANLNINRLGAIARRYRVNVYGESESPLHGGLPTDRFEAEWFLEGERVRRAAAREVPDFPRWEELPRANETTDKGGFPACADELVLDIENEALLVEVPKKITDLMAHDGELALDWRLKTRRIFQNYFERRYSLTWVHRADERVFYRLELEEAPID